MTIHFQELTAGRWQSNSLFVKRLNIGCGKYPLPGFTNLDEHEPADIKCNIWDHDFHDLEEVRMDHFLEHIPWKRTHELLERVHSWLKPGGKVVIEVPNIEEIMRRGLTQHDWQRYLYGSQQHEGEFHRAGFTASTLESQLLCAGFHDVTVNKFFSQFHTRLGMACLLAQGVA